MCVCTNKKNAIKFFAVLLIFAFLFTHYEFLCNNLVSAQISKEPNTVIDAATRNSNDIVVPSTSFREFAGAEVKREIVDGKNAISYINEDGYIEALFNVEAAGDYVLSISYFALEGKGRDVEFGLKIDGEFIDDNESIYSLPRIWRDANSTRKKDSQGNELRSEQEEVYRWQAKLIRSYEVMSDEDTTFHFSEGVHTIRIESFREPFAISDITFKRPKECENYSAPAENQSAIGFSKIFEAENVYEKTQSILYPMYDRVNVETSPNSPTEIRLNTIGKENWKNAGQSITWQITVPKAGYYYLAFRARQNFVSGISSNRRIYINDEIPFSQARAISFPYNLNWYTKTVGDDNPYLFYLNEGVNTLTLEVVIGEIADSLKVVEKAVAELNALYRQTIMITGISPDLYRDYYIEKELPGFCDTLVRIADTLEKESEVIDNIMGSSGGKTSTISEIVYQLRSISKDPETIAERLDRFKSNISTLGTWVLDLKEQPLELDYISVWSPDAEQPQNKKSFFAQIIFDIKGFIFSFAADYNAIGSVYEGKQTSNLKVWAVGTGRDQAQIIKSIIDNDFCPKTQIGVNLSLVTDVSTLIQATLGGKGPDVAMMIPQDTPVNLAFRGALVELSQFDGFDEIKSQFYDSAFTPFVYDGGIYALPITQSYPMMYIRNDVFEELEIEVPKTWDEFYSVVRFIQRKNMTVGIAFSQSIFESLIFQRNSHVYSHDLSQVNFEDPLVMDAFNQWTSFYTKYSFPVEFDLYNRFRSGEIPLGISTLSFYNQLYVAAPEIRGLWGMYPLPGIKNEDGVINRTVSSTVTGIIMMSGIKNPKAGFEFMKWWVSDKVQAQYGLEVENVMGPLARYETANKNAFYSLPWSRDAEKTILEQWSNVDAVEQVPGGYFVSRNITFAFRKVVYDFTNKGILNNHVEVLSKYSREINAELVIKSKEIDKYIKEDTEHENE